MAVTSFSSFAAASGPAIGPVITVGTLPVDRFGADEVLRNIERRCRCAACGWRRVDLRPDYSVQQAPRTSVGWIKPPS